jgi:hypothetical protein
MSAIVVVVVAATFKQGINITYKDSLGSRLNVLLLRTDSCSAGNASRDAWSRSDLQFCHDG